VWSSAVRTIALTAAASLGAALTHAQNATPAVVPAKPQCLVSDVASAPATATPSAFPATETTAADKNPAAPALAEEVRKGIFIELQQIVARAQRDAGVAYPIGARAPMLSPTNVEKPANLSGKRESMAMSLERTYLAELLARRSLVCASARDIMREGRKARWPVAKLEEKSQK
jgi:hypothetical protein